MQVEVISELEQENGWKFSVTFGEQACELSLSWSDYNFWSPGGTLPPANIADAVARVMLEHGPSEIPIRLDASLLRRLIDGGDQLVRQQLGSERP